MEEVGRRLTQDQHGRQMVGAIQQILGSAQRLQSLLGVVYERCSVLSQALVHGLHAALDQVAGDHHQILSHGDEGCSRLHEGVAGVHHHDNGKQHGQRAANGLGHHAYRHTNHHGNDGSQQHLQHHSSHRGSTSRQTCHGTACRWIEPGNDDGDDDDEHLEQASLIPLQFHHHQAVAHQLHAAGVQQFSGSQRVFLGDGLIQGDVQNVLGGITGGTVVALHPVGHGKAQHLDFRVHGIGELVLVDIDLVWDAHSRGPTTFGLIQGVLFILFLEGCLVGAHLAQLPTHRPPGQIPGLEGHTKTGIPHLQFQQVSLTGLGRCQP